MTINTITTIHIIEITFIIVLITILILMVDDKNGIFVQLRFDKRNYEDPRKACNDLKEKLKPGMYLRIQGNVAPDKFLFDEMVMQPTSIMKVDAPPERADKAEVIYSQGLDVVLIKVIEKIIISTYIPMFISII